MERRSREDAHACKNQRYPSGVVGAGRACDLLIGERKIDSKPVRHSDRSFPTGCILGTTMRLSVRTRLLLTALMSRAPDLPPTIIILLRLLLT